jgi:hypothetical protein
LEALDREAVPGAVVEAALELLGGRSLRGVASCLVHPIAQKGCDLVALLGAPQTRRSVEQPSHALPSISELRISFPFEAELHARAHWATLDCVVHVRDELGAVAQSIVEMRSHLVDEVILNGLALALLE